MCGGSAQVTASTFRGGWHRKVTEGVLVLTWTQCYTGKTETPSVHCVATPGAAARPPLKTVHRTVFRALRPPRGGGFYGDPPAAAGRTRNRMAARGPPLHGALRRMPGNVITWSCLSHGPAGGLIPRHPLSLLCRLPFSYSSRIKDFLFFPLPAFQIHDQKIPDSRLIQKAGRTHTLPLITL